MDKAKSASSRMELVVAIAAGTALLWASLANYVTHNDYPVLRPEIGLVALALLAFSALVALLFVGQRQWVRSFFEGLLAALFVDLNTDSIPLVIAAGVAVGGITLWKRTSLLAPMALFGTVILIATLVSSGSREPWLHTTVNRAPPPGKTNNAKPAIVHLILDEHIGIEGLPADQDAQRLKEELKAFYLRHGFALYGRAYSQHLHTVNAIPAVLNFGESLAKEASTKGVVIGQTRHLKNLVDDGYRLTIFESDFADFCTGSAFAECVRYDSSSLRPTLALKLSAVERARLITLKLMSLSEIVNYVLLPYNVAAHSLRNSGYDFKVLLPSEDARSSTVGSIAAIDELSKRLKNARPGEAYFAHLLVPHYPYVVGADCKGLPFGEWRRRFGPWRFKVRQHAYYAQVRCTMVEVDRLLNALASSPAGSNAVVIIHGDHGSRLTTVDPTEDSRGYFSDDDMIAAFSTLFAVRGPGVQAGYFTEPSPIPSLLHAFDESGFRQAPRPAASKIHEVTLDDSNWTARSKAPLPDAWVR